jgi:hypothetical protein
LDCKLGWSCNTDLWIYFRVEVQFGWCNLGVGKLLYCRLDSVESDMSILVGKYCTGSDMGVLQVGSCCEVRWVYCRLNCAGKPDGCTAGCLVQWVYCRLDCTAG